MKKLLQLGIITVWLLSPQFLSAQCATDLFISEYVEGSGNNKYIEIFNGTGAAIDLSNYSLRLYSNGASSPNTSSALSGILADGAVIVYQNSSASIYTGTATNLGAVNFNGDDAIELYNTSTNTAVDIFGEIGVDPGSQWTVSTNNTQNQTLQRNNSVFGGNTSNSAGFPSLGTEWTEFAEDDVSGLGSHSINCGVTPCTAPNSDASVILTPFLSSIQVDITPPTGGADGYFTVIKTVNSITAPTNTTSYSVGSAYDGGTVAGFGTSTSFSISGLSSNTTYYVFVFAYNSSGCTGGPVYASVVSPTPSTNTLVSNPTTLNPGDLLIVGFDTYTGSGGVDRIVLTNFKAIGPGTTFLIANAVYEFKAGAAERTDRWYNGNGNFGFDVPLIEVTYEGSGLTAGSVLCIDLNTVGSLGGVSISGIDVSAQFSETDPSTGKFVQLSSSSADALFLMQGTFSNGQIDTDGDTYGTLDVGGVVLGGLQTAGNFQSFALAGNAGGSRVSRVHPDIECFALSTGGSSGGFFGYYNVATELINGTQHNLLKEIANFGGTWISGSTSGTAGDVDDISSVICAPGFSFTVTAEAEAGNWIGDTDEDWFNCLNWDNLQVPDENTNVTLGSDAIDNCEIDISVFSVNAAKFDNIASCNDLTLSNATFKLEISSGTEDTLIVNGDLTLEEGASTLADDGGFLDMTDGANGGTLIIKGDWNEFNIPNNRFEEGIGSKVLFNGNSQQTITVAATGASPTAGVEFANFEIDNSTGLILAGRAEVTQEAIFTDGIITSQSGLLDGSGIGTAINVFVISEGSLVSSVSDASHVDGVVAKFGSADFTYPVGNGTFYRPATLIGSTGAVATDEFRVEYFSNDPAGTFTSSNGAAISNAEFWNIERSAGSASKSVQLSWDQSKTSDVSNPSVVKLNTITNPMTDFWELAGGNGQATTTGPGTAGEVSSALVSSFSPFSLTDATPFPIELLYFKGKIEDRNVRLSWETTLEINNSHFILERSQDNRHFDAITEIPAIGTEKGAYQYLDTRPNIGKNYYRLIQVDFDGSTSTSHTIEVNLLETGVAGVWAVYPNPSNGFINFDMQLPETAQVRFNIINVQGQLVKTETAMYSKGQQSHRMNTSSLAAGFYHYEILLSGRRIRGKFQKK
ncbi:MAG: lamin tail domain-containing protein [Bacteroidia bacterium]|nr:lamin tail domain-containing protein [Bacteroidia bacterium]